MPLTTPTPGFLEAFEKSILLKWIPRSLGEVVDPRCALCREASAVAHASEDSSACEVCPLVTHGEARPDCSSTPYGNWLRLRGQAAEAAAATSETFYLIAAMRAYELSEPLVTDTI
jgi:hypothetical protein